MAELAALAGLSSSTISRALSNHWSINAQTRERVQALARVLATSLGCLSVLPS